MWTRFLKWIDNVVNKRDKIWFGIGWWYGTPALLDNPVVVLVGHNSIRFDFPLLLCELLRHNLPTAMFERWHFADTLHIFKDLNQYSCIKLQCMARDTNTDPGHCHRALHDAITLRKITNIFTQRIGISTRHLLSCYLVELDLASSIAQLTTLM